jgi:hypothetical protein
MTGIAVIDTQISTKNPVLYRELLYQRRTTVSRWRRREPLLVANLVAILLACIVAIYPADEPFPLFFFVWGFHLIALIRVTLAGVDVISREHLNGTWESLILTGIDTRKIFFAKWLAVARSIWGWIVATAVFWIGWVGILLWLEANSYPYRSNPPTYTIIVWPTLAIIFAVMEFVCCVSLGVAASAVTRRRNLAILLASSLRIVPSILCSVVVIGIFVNESYGNYGGFEFFPILVGLSEPSILLLLLSIGSGAWTVLPGLIAGGLLLIGMTVLALVAGLAAVRRIER